MSYGCSMWNSETKNLYEAQMNKMDVLKFKMKIKEGSNILDMGCGWGFLASYFANSTKGNSTGITVAPAQYKYAKRMFQNERTHYHLLDYRKLPEVYPHGFFDAITSVGMPQPSLSLSAVPL